MTREAASKYMTISCPVHSLDMVKKILLVVDYQLLAEVASHGVGLLLDDLLGLAVALSRLPGVGLDP